MLLHAIIGILLFGRELETKRKKNNNNIIENGLNSVRGEGINELYSGFADYFLSTKQNDSEMDVHKTSAKRSIC